MNKSNDILSNKFAVHIRHSECPLLALTHALNRLMKQWICQRNPTVRSFQIDWRATFSSEIFVGCGWYF